jgi:two-component system NtrC family sensor kinase
MNIAVVGGGTRCLALLELINKHAFQNLSTIVVAVADIKNDAPGFVKANEMGLFTTNDYNDFFDRDDINLIVELTGNKGVFIDILSKKKDDVWAISHRIAALFWDLGFISAQQDIKNKLEKIRFTHRMFNVLINEMIQEDIMVIGSDFRILNMNETLLKKVGLEREEVLGQYCYQIIHKQNEPCSGKNHKCPLIQTLKTHKPSKETHIHKNKDDKDVYYSISTYPIFEKNEVIGAIEVSRDITLDINVRQTMMQQDKLASLGKLAATIAHEINNPLATVLTYIRLMIKLISLNRFSPERLEDISRYLATMESETARCGDIVKNLLAFSRQSKITFSSHSIVNIIDRALILIAHDLKIKEIQLKKSIESNMPKIQCDFNQIQQVLLALMYNASEALQKGGILTVTANRSVAAEGFLEVVISDTGCGIAEEDMENIFEPFFTTKEEGKGVGLGLAVAYSIIHRHNGTIAVESELDKGSMFKVLLPFE